VAVVANAWRAHRSDTVCAQLKIPKIVKGHAYPVIRCVHSIRPEVDA